MMIMIDDVTSIFVIDNADEWTMRVTNSAVVGSSDPSLIIIVKIALRLWGFIDNNCFYRIDFRQMSKMMKIYGIDKDDDNFLID